MLQPIRLSGPPISRFSGPPVSLGNGSITENDIIDELQHRGYTVRVIHHAPVIHHVVTPTRLQVISIAIDEALEAYQIAHTYAHPFTCPATAGCTIEPATWDAMVTWTTRVANGYLEGRYTLPIWASEWIKAGAPHVWYHSSFHGAYLSGFGDFSDWLQENPWVVTSLGAALKTYGDYLTAQNVKDEIKATIPKDVMTKSDVATLLAALQNQGVIPTGKEAVVAKGAQAAAMPSWLMPVLIAGGALVVFMMMKK